MELWNNLEGSVIEGRYPLRKLVRSEGRCAWFESQSVEGGSKPVVISLTESLNDQDVLLARLRAAAQLRHPNVVAIEQTGVATLHGEPLVYAVAEYTEENLADVLRDRALSQEEARQLLNGMLAGLSAIHGKKLVHSRMEAASVLAAGETIKLRSDCIQQPGTDASFASLAAEDVRGLGNTVFQALTQRQPQSASDPAIARLAAPFSQVVRRALSGQATTSEITTLLQTDGKSAAAPVSSSPIPAGSINREKPAIARTSSPINDEDASSDDAPVRRNGPYIIAALVVLLLVVAWLLHSALRHPSRASTSAAAPASAPMPEAVTPDAPPAIKPAPTAPEPQVQPTPATKPQAPAVAATPPIRAIHLARRRLHLQPSRSGPAQSRPGQSTLSESAMCGVFRRMEGRPIWSRWAAVPWTAMRPYNCA